MTATCEFTDAEVLQIFVESVDELLQSDFLAQVKDNGISTKLQWSHETGFLSQRTGPHRDAVKAFVLTLRFFGQNNEPTSLCNMQKRVDGLNVDPLLKEQFRNSRSNFNAYLDSAPSIGFPPESKANTRRQIFEAFVYGIFAHANPKHRRQAKMWEQDVFYEHVRSEFDRILLSYLQAVAAMATVCSDCLAAGQAEPGDAMDSRASPHVIADPRAKSL